MSNHDLTGIPGEFSDPQASSRDSVFFHRKSGHPVLFSPAAAQRAQIRVTTKQSLSGDFHFYLLEMRFRLDKLCHEFVRASDDQSTAGICRYVA